MVLNAKQLLLDTPLVGFSGGASGSSASSTAASTPASTLTSAAMSRSPSLSSLTVVPTLHLPGASATSSPGTPQSLSTLTVGPGVGSQQNSPGSPLNVSSRVSARQSTTSSPRQSTPSTPRRRSAGNPILPPTLVEDAPPLARGPSPLMRAAWEAASNAEYVSPRRLPSSSSARSPSPRRSLGGPSPLRSRESSVNSFSSFGESRLSQIKVL